MKKTKGSGIIGRYAPVIAAICVLLFIIVAVFMVPSGFFGRPIQDAEAASAFLPDASDADTADADTADADTSEDDTTDSSGNDSIFRVADAETLYMLAESDALEEFYGLHGEEPIVVISDSILLDRTLDIHSGVELVMEGYVAFAYDDVKIHITAEGARRISISGDEPISRFEIDAPESALYFDGGVIPLIREVAETQNVESYNGVPVIGAADGDTLGGTGRGRIIEVTVFSDESKTEVRDGMYSQVKGNLITVYIPHDADDKDVESLCISVTVVGGECDTSEAFDLTSPKLINVADPSGGIRTYRISAERARLGIPILEIYTDDGSEIDSKEEYKTAVMRLDGKEYTTRIRGRGNSSWSTFPKRSYRLKLDSKADLCGMAADRDWCLVSNYVDPSLIRNKVASDMAKSMSALPFTPSYKSVDLFINGEYLGVYMLSEKIEDDKDRVPLGDPITDEEGSILDMGFLIEFGWDYSSENVYAKDFFDTEYCKRMYIKEPEIVKAYNAEYKYVYNYVKAAEKAVIAGKGYEEYLDVDSWVDWFIVNELTNNTECAFYRSLYMYKPVGGKLTAGPIWDYDTAFGNHLNDISGYNGWASVDFTYDYMSENWMKFLIEDEYFMSRVRARWAEIKDSLMETAFSSIEKSAEEIDKSQVYNFRVWPKVLRGRIGLSRASTLGFTTWQEHVDYIGEFLKMRYEWMDERLS